MRHLACFCLVVMLVVPATSSAQNDRFAAVQIETVPVAGSISMLVGVGGNIGVFAAPDGVFLIDDQFAPLTEKIRTAVGKITAQPIRFVLNTHWHSDHTGGNESLGETGTLIVAHDNVRTRMAAGQLIEALGMNEPPAAPGALPVVTFSDTMTFWLGEEEVHAYHTPPAHTDGDAIVHFRTSNVVHMGDLYFARTFPFIDLSSGGNIDGLIEALGTALGHMDAETKIIPGHGPLSNRGDLTTYRDMLVKVRNRVADLKEAGKSLADTVAAKPLADLDEQWGGGFIKADQLVTFAYQSLQ